MRKERGIVDWFIGGISLLRGGRMTEQEKRKNFEDLIRPHVSGDTPEAIELAIQDNLKEFDRYLDGRPITATEVRNFLQMKAAEQQEQKQQRVSPPRLSETEEVQAAFKREMALLFTEVGTPPPDMATGVIDGKGLGEGFRRFPTRHWEDLRLKPEHVRVLLSLTFLLEQCERLEATPQQLAIVLSMFHPAKPTLAWLRMRTSRS